MYGLEPFVYFHPKIFEDINQSSNKIRKWFPDIEIYQYNHSWRFFKYFKKFLFSELKNVKMFQRVKEFQQKSYYSFRSHVKKIIRHQSISSNCKFIFIFLNKS